MSKLWPKYKNWLKQENQNRLYRYKSNMYRYKLVKNDQNRSCTGTSSTCTGTSLRKVPRMCVFPIFHALSSMDHSYTPYTHQNHSKFTLESLCTQFLFHFLSSFKTFPLISPNIILIWVTTHIHTKYQDFLGFDQNPNSISFHLTMNPTTKEGFHNYLVPCGLYQP